MKDWIISIILWAGVGITLWNDWTKKDKKENSRRIDQLERRVRLLEGKLSPRKSDLEKTEWVWGLDTAKVGETEGVGIILVPDEDCKKKGGI